MNDRFHAQRLLAAVQTALRSGEWTPADDSLVKFAVPALERTLIDGSTTQTVSYHLDRLAELVGDAVTTGEWMPGDWASEWQGWYVDGMRSGHVAFMPPSEKIAIRRLAA